MTQLPFAAALQRLTAWWDWRVIRRGFWTAILVGAFLISMRAVHPDPLDPGHLAMALARDELFDFAAWETGALGEKAANGLFGPQRYMSETDRIHYVRDYLQIVNDIARLEDQVKAVYADPAIADPAAASADLRARRDALRAEQTASQTIAEAIIQAQIAQMLVEVGFGLGGQVLPPVGLRFTQLPTLLVISPRDRIERIGSYPLDHGLTVDAQQALEDSIDEEANVSSLIVPLGGLAVYPAMLIETGYAPHVFQIGAHEWVHHYLSFFPLGMNYGVTPDLYTINETVASIVGDEVGRAVLVEYYPDLAPPPPPPFDPNAPPSPPPPPGEPPAFDFRAEMRLTRIHVDALLAAGEVEAAEHYMEERRALFVANGYQIRKLNQAYFAFYGAYADEPGAGGSDPIGPALRELRYYSASLHDFVAQVRWFKSFGEIEEALMDAREVAAGG
jgi:hypothetical protein